MKNKDKLNEEMDLSKSAPFLFGIPKKDVFSVPDHYFDELPSKIQERCLHESKSLSIFLRIKLILLSSSYSNRSFSPRVVFAGVSFAILVAGGFYFLSNEKVEPSIEIAETPIQILSDYIDEEFLAEALEKEQTKSQTKDSIKSERKLIEDYLLDQNVDVTLITYEL